VYGWGSIDTFAAGRLIEGTDGQAILAEDVPKNQTRSLSLNAAPSGTPIRITAVWHDPPAPANLGNIDDPMLTLQNDVNLELVAPGGQVFRPYVLNPATPAAAASTGNNQRDNVEVIDAPTQAGQWTLKLIGTQFKSGDSQAVSLVISGLVSP
jgi:hypothetical protein